MAIYSFFKFFARDIEGKPLSHLDNYDSLTQLIFNTLSVKGFVEDMGETAKRGEIQRAYERESVMEELISAVSQGVVILCGPSGSGKTALFEDFAFRVVRDEIPSFSGWRVFRLKLKQLQGEKSLEGSVNRLLDGGPSNRFQILMNYIQKTDSDDKSWIVIIDEIQDLLEGNIALFDAYK